MPYVFRFHTEGRPDFVGNVQSMQCAAMNAKGGRCKCRVSLGAPYCWIHLLHKHHLRIKPSPIPGAGKGLFAMGPPNGPRLFKRGDVIIVYDGQHISQQTLDARYGDDDVAAPYAVETHGDVEDAALRRGAGAICNHAAGPAQNARIVYRGNRHVIVATKQIFNGTEVLVDYGHNYWDGGNGTYSTKAR